MSDRHCLIIAEVAQAHDGSLGTAHSYIDLAAAAGAGAVKFQTHIADAESHPSEPWRVKFSVQDESRYEYWKRMEFTRSQWRELHTHAHERGLEFISSPFSVEAVEMLTETGIDRWKIASGELTNIPMLERIAEDGRPVILSSGMRPLAELANAVTLFRQRGSHVTILQCTTQYPCPPERTGLNLIAQFRDRYQLPVGLSDHSGEIFAGLAAATLGIDVLEVHVVFSRDCFGPDVSSSLTREQLTMLVDGIRFIETAMKNPVDKDQLASEHTEVRRLFTRSIVARYDLPEGHRLTGDDVIMKKPGTGLNPTRLPSLLGQRLRHFVAANSILSIDDFEGAK